MLLLSCSLIQVKHAYTVESNHFYITGYQKQKSSFPVHISHSPDAIRFFFSVVPFCFYLSISKEHFYNDATSCCFLFLCLFVLGIINSLSKVERILLFSISCPHHTLPSHLPIIVISQVGEITLQCLHYPM